MLKLSYDDLFLNIVLFLLCLFPVLLSLFLVTDGETTGFIFNLQINTNGTTCLFKSLTGYNCPACGMTRSFIHMSDLNFRSAWEMNKAGALLFIFCILQSVYRILLIIGTRVNRYRFIRVAGFTYLIITGIIAFADFVAQFFW